MKTKQYLLDRSLYSYDLSLTHVDENAERKIHAVSQVLGEGHRHFTPPFGGPDKTDIDDSTWFYELGSTGGVIYLKTPEQAMLVGFIL